MDAQQHIDDVDVYEEEGQLQNIDEQQQQDDESEGVDEPEDGEEEDKEVEDDEEVDDIIPRRQDNSFYHHQTFVYTCSGIENDDPDYDEFDSGSLSLNDHRAVMLGRALSSNTELTNLAVSFLMETEFTSQGARAFVEGIVGSQVKSLYLLRTVELPIEMSQLGARSIEKLYLNFPIGDEFAHQLCESLMASKLLGHLTISVDYMTPRGARTLSKYLQRSPIKSLEFMAWRKAVSTLTMQRLYHEGVQHCPDIEHLTVKDILGDMRALVTTLPKLCELTIKKVHLTLAEVEILSRGLTHAGNVTSLSLSECKLNDAHMKVLSPVLGNHRFIKTVMLDANQIGPKGARILFKALSHHSILYSLDLDSNKSIGFDGLQLIGKALPDAKVQKLSLYNLASWIEYENADCDAAVRQEAKRTAAGKAMLEGVQGNSHLLQMDLRNSHLPTIVTEEINLYLDANARGRRAVLEHSHALPSGVWSHFLAKEGMTSSLLFLFLRELPSLMIGCGSCKIIGRKRCRQ